MQDVCEKIKPFLQFTTDASFLGREKTRATEDRASQGALQSEA